MLPVGRQVRERRAGNVNRLRKNITFKPSLWPAIEEGGRAKQSPGE